MEIFDVEKPKLRDTSPNLFISSSVSLAMKHNGKNLLDKGVLLEMEIVQCQYISINDALPTSRSVLNEFK